MTIARDEFAVALTRDLIRFQSVNPPGDEQPVAEFLAGVLGRHGIAAEIQPIEPGRANLLARLPGEGAGSLIFTGHLDVVPPGEQPWEHGPFTGDLVDGKVYGRGSADMKGGVAAIVAAMILLKEQGVRPAGDIVLAATAGEEAGLYGAGVMAQRRSLEGARWLVVAEPTDLNVFIAEKGILWADVTAAGRTAHGSMPHLGVNAISYMARLIERLDGTYPFPYTASPLLGAPTLSVDVIRGGNKSNVVPDLCRISIDMRTVPSQHHEEIIRSLGRLAREVADDFNPAIAVTVDVVHDERSVETPRQDPLVQAAIRAVTRVRGREPEVGGVAYATDAAVFGPAFDIPMVICGPGAPGMAHQPNEHVEVEQLVQATQIYADLAMDLLRSDPA